MAIVFDATSNSTEQASASSVSWSHTCTGSNLVLVVGISSRDITLGNRTVSSVTYNGVTLTKARSDDNALTARTEMWYLINPSTGSNTVTVTMGGVCTGFICGAVSLTGVKQSGQPDASNGFESVPNVTTATCNVTTVADNSWIVDIFRTTIAATGCSAGGSQTQRWFVSGALLQAGMSTQGPKTPAGSTTDSWSWTTSAPATLTAVSFSPFVATSTNSNFLAFM
jgi:hypothetical protein